MPLWLFFLNNFTLSLKIFLFTHSYLPWPVAPSGWISGSCLGHGIYLTLFIICTSFIFSVTGVQKSVLMKLYRTIILYAFDMVSMLFFLFYVASSCLKIHAQALCSEPHKLPSGSADEI
jgi:hypothetical protein